MPPHNLHPIPADALALQAEKSILLLREQKVMLDFHLAELYAVETRALKQAVRRNASRFPDDFMFELTAEEIQHLVSQTVIPGLGKLGGATPMAFTEQGVAMLSSVLRGERAVQVNIAIMRAFVRLREMCLPPMLASPASWRKLRGNMMVSSALCLMLSGSSWHLLLSRLAKWAFIPSRMRSKNTNFRNLEKANCDTKCLTFRELK